MKEDSPLRSVREAFLKLLFAERNAGVCQRLEAKIADVLRDERHRTFLQTWLQQIQSQAQPDEACGTLIQDGLDAIERNQTGQLLELLVGFSLMRVASEYDQIVYESICFDLLPESINRYILGSVAVPRKNNTQEWSGSVGQ